MQYFPTHAYITLFYLITVQNNMSKRYSALLFREYQMNCAVWCTIAGKQRPNAIRTVAFKYTYKHRVVTNHQAASLDHIYYISCITHSREYTCIRTLANKRCAKIAQNNRYYVNNKRIDYTYIYLYTRKRSANNPTENHLIFSTEHVFT